MSCQKSHKKNLYIILAIISFSAAISVFFICFPFHKLRDMHHLSNHTYNSAFISMYSIENYSKEAFATFRGLDVNITTHTARNISEITDYLDIIFRSGNSIDTIYIGLDPSVFYSNGNTTEDDMANEMSSLLNYFTVYPNVTFEILLPSPSIHYWTSMDSDEVEEVLLSYRYAVSCIEPHSNVISFFIGNEEWLLCNPANYTNTFAPNALVSEKILCLTFCDRQSQINTANAEASLNVLKEIIFREQESPAQYPDLSTHSIVFFGDSILGLHNGSYSVPGVINSLTGASVYNYALGGTTACHTGEDQNADTCFAEQLELFLNQEVLRTRDNTTFPYDTANDENLIFVINYGYNDYMCCATSDGFYQTLNTEISRLQQKYPHSQIIIMAPYECTYYGNGLSTTNNIGESLTDYTDVVKQIASDRGITCLDVPSVIDVNENNFTAYFNDECHYGEYGRFRLAQHIITAIE